MSLGTVIAGRLVWGFQDSRGLHCSRSKSSHKLKFQVPVYKACLESKPQLCLLNERKIFHSIDLPLQIFCGISKQKQLSTNSDVHTISLI